jgi:hypothetical protein
MGAFNWLTALVGLRVTTPVAQLPLPPGASTMIDVANPETMSMVVNTFILIVIGLALLDLIIVTPLALLGWWAYGAGGSDAQPRTSPAPSGCASWLDVIAVVVVSFNLALQALFRASGMADNHTPLNDALGGGGILGLLLLAVLNFVLFWPSVAWLAFRLGAWLFRRMRGPGAAL